ncbi:MAG: plastocyanin/azurin family copper-binding protein, partial [Actinomycetota bacterium]|nr:plastocyanin/azurin family copper-binding protein [Actinomycetota bacterium]
MLFSPAAHAAGREVLVVDTAYEPALARVQAGDTVVWRWGSQNVSPHTVTAVDTSFDSDRECRDSAECRAPGHAFAWKFSQPGIYAYRCKVHAVMLGRVEVAEAGPQQEPPPPAPATSPAASGCRPQA